jgi:hypothetical protein
MPKGGVDKEKAMKTITKKLLRLWLVAGSILLFSMPGWAGTIYLSDSAAGGTGNSRLYTVVLDAGSSRANLTTLTTLAYDNVCNAPPKSRHF